MNINDFSIKAGVSVATISRALNAGTRLKVAPATLARIEKLALQYGYTPNGAARSLRQNASRTLGVVFPYLPGIFYSNYYNHILAGVSDYLRGTDYQFKMLLLDENKDKWDRYDFKRGEHVDALVMVHWFRYFSSRKALKNIGIPCVVINDIEKDAGIQFAGIDNFLGGQMAANYLLEQGHRKVGILSGPDWSIDNRQRVEGFLALYKSKGVAVPATCILKADYLEEKAYAEADELIRRKTGITAVFTCNDQMAFGLIRRFKELGCSCPKDISVIGFDDEYLAPRFDPPLTTIHVPVYDVAREATALLIKQLSHPASSHLSGVKYFSTRLIERHSVRSLL